MTSTLIISTYNWPQALELVLKSIQNQSKMPSEIIVAEDGEDEETKSLLTTYSEKFEIPLIHVRHEDKGFRKAVIINKAIAKASGDYIIQADGDCILHRHFVNDHLSFASNNMYLYGSRVNIQKNYLETLFENKQIKFSPFSQGIKKRTRALYLPLLSSLYKEHSEFSSKYRGCNTSYFREDAIKVNGYNESIQGWGREDSEFAIRLLNSGVNGRRLRYRGIVFHIFHPEKSRDQLDRNDKIEKETIKNNITWCKLGIDQYL